MKTFAPRETRAPLLSCRRIPPARPTVCGQVGMKSGEEGGRGGGGGKGSRSRVVTARARDFFARLGLGRGDFPLVIQLRSGRGAGPFGLVANVSKSYYKEKGERRDLFEACGALVEGEAGLMIGHVGSARVSEHDGSTVPRG